MTNIDGQTARTIAILLPDMRPGGAERVCLNLAHGFLARGYEVDLLLMRAHGDLLSEVSERVRIVDFNVPRFRGMFLPMLRYLRSRRPAALLVAMWPVTVLAIVVARLVRNPPRVIVSDHNALSRSTASTSWLRRWLLKRSIRWLYPRAGSVVTVSQGVADDMVALTGLPAVLITTIYNPATRGKLPNALSADDRVGGWHQPGYKRVISVGTLKLQKNYRLLIAAFATLRQQLQAKLLILGEGTLRGELEAQARELGIADDVVLYGFVDDPYPYYFASDLFVLSSDYEGFGNVLVEAMECGLPVVSTDCVAGPAEILDGGRFGRLVPVGDADALAEAMQAALREPTDVQRQRARAGEFSSARAVDAYLALLDPPSVMNRAGKHAETSGQCNGEAESL